MHRDGLRRCAKPSCGASAVAWMSYDYAASTVFVGSLIDDPDPSRYDLCRTHLDGLRPPQGWTVRQVLQSVGDGTKRLAGDAPVVRPSPTEVAVNAEDRVNVVEATGR